MWLAVIVGAVWVLGALVVWAAVHGGERRSRAARAARVAAAEARWRQVWR